MPELAYAVVFTYLPDKEETLHTVFSQADDCPDPLTTAHNFAKAEQAANDFPNSLWTVTGNEEAIVIRGEKLTQQLGL